VPDISRLVIEINSKGVVQATGNLEKFNDAAAKASKGTDVLTRSSKGAVKESADLAKTFGAFQLVVNKLPGPLQSIVSGLMGMVSPATAVVSLFLELGAAAVRFAKESVQAFSEFEMIKTNLEVVMGSEKDAVKIFNEIKHMASSTPFNTDQLAEVATMLKQVGVSANDLIPTLIMLGDVSGGSMEKLNRIGFNYAQIMSMGKAMAIDLRQFAMAGVPIYKMLEEMGVKGEATAQDITEAFRRMTSEGGTFFNAMEKGAKTLSGMNTNLDGLKKQYKALAAEVNGSSELAKWWAKVWTEAYQKKIAGLQEILDKQEAIKKMESGNRVDREEAELFFAEERLKITEKIIAEELKYYKITEAQYLLELEKHKLSGAYDTLPQGYKELESLLKSRNVFLENVKSAKKLVDAEKIRTAEIERQMKIIEAQRKETQKIIDKAQSVYENTSEGRIESIKKEIADAQRTLESNLSTEKITTQRPYGDSVETYRKLNEEERRNLNTLIRELQKNLRDLLGGEKKDSKDTKREEKKPAPVLQDWQQVMKTAFGFSDKEDVYLNKGLTAVDHLLENIEKQKALLTSGEEGQTLADTLGMTDIDVAMEGINRMTSGLQGMVNSDLWNGTEESLKKLIDSLRAASEENFIASLEQELEDAAKSTHDLNVERLILEHKVSREIAVQGIEMQKMSHYIANGANYMRELDETMNDALKKIRAGKGGYGEYAGAAFKEGGMGLLEGSDVGNFVDGMQKGGIWVAIIETLVGALAKVLGGMEEFQKVLNPVTHLLSNLSSVVQFLNEIIMQIFNEVIAALKPVFVLIGEILQVVKPLLSEIIHTITGAVQDILSTLAPLVLVIQVLAPVFSGLAWVVRRVFDGLKWFANIIFGGLISAASDFFDSFSAIADEQNEESERLRTINEQYKTLTAALKEQEEYYLQKRRNLESEWAIENYQSRQVNDMILTPSGNFSTSPDDYIIATKNPQSLGGGSTVNVVVNNYANNTAVERHETARADGGMDIVIAVKNIVAKELSTGGFDGAMDAMNKRRHGMTTT
jgi:hypothetical protein